MIIEVTEANDELLEETLNSITNLLDINDIKYKGIIEDGHFKIDIDDSIWTKKNLYRVS